MDLKDLVVPVPRTRRLLARIDRCLDEMPEPPYDDDEYDDGYEEEMDWSDWEQPTVNDDDW